MGNTWTFTLLSGGIDSSTCLARACRDFAPANARAISVDYGQRHDKEILAAKAICQHYGVSQFKIELGPQPESALTSTDRLIPRTTYAELPEGMSPSYHHFRNGQLLSAAAAWAVSLLENEEDNGVLYFGAHAEDAANWAYADCTPEFVGAMANAIFIGTYQKIRLATPYLFSRKWEIIRDGDEMEVPYEMTWSCYLGGDIHCGTCPTCRARKDAFNEADIFDPTKYEDESPIEEDEETQILG